MIFLFNHPSLVSSFKSSEVILFQKSEKNAIDIDHFFPFASVMTGDFTRAPDLPFDKISASTQ